ncbi:MAG TPA: chemotaxis protein CheW [Abditibacteriaceae bacterium]|nr:chemotaxis protein CheW [Abditibacteriaceae bacterium]
MSEASLITARNEILQTRARELAREPERGDVAVEHLEVIEFVLAHETYAIEAIYIRDVHTLRELTPVPCTPPFVLGLINVRGRILTVIDIKQFFGLPQKGLTDLSKVLVIHTADMDVGIAADAVKGVLSIPLKDIQPSLPTLTGIRAEYLRGVTKERLVVLDARKLLSDPKIMVDEEVEG